MCNTSANNNRKYSFPILDEIVLAFYCCSTKFCGDDGHLVTREQATQAGNHPFLYDLKHIGDHRLFLVAISVILADQVDERGPLGSTVTSSTVLLQH